MSVVIILPARLASVRLPNKLLLDRTGKTVLEHTLERALSAAADGSVSRVIVAADDERLMAVARKCGVEAVLTDPSHTSGTDRVAEAARKTGGEFIVNLQADEPEIDPQSIRTVAGLLTRCGETAPMSTLAVPVFDEETFRKPSVVKVAVAANGNALYFSRAPIPFVRDPAQDAQAWQMNGRRVFGLHHLGLYAYRREFLLSYKTLPASRLEQLEKLEQLRALEAGHTIKVGIVKENPPGIDTPEDYEAFVARRGK